MSTTSPYSTPQSQSGVGFEVDYEPKVFSFNGRIGRLRYLAYGMAWTFVFIIPIAIGGALIGAGAGERGILAIAGIGIMIISYIGMLAGSWGMMVRRLNDMDKSGWLSLLMIVPLVNFGMALYLLFGPGTQGNNSYGPKPCQNSTGVIVAASVLPAIFIIGILAAIALPAYQQYSMRAAGLNDEYSPASQALLYVGDVQDLVADYVIENEVFPEQNSDIGISWQSSSQYIESIDVSTGGKITVVLTASDTNYEGRTMEFVPYVEDGYIDWECSGGTLDSNYRPASCTP